MTDISDAGLEKLVDTIYERWLSDAVVEYNEYDAVIIKADILATIKSVLAARLALVWPSLLDFEYERLEEGRKHKHLRSMPARQTRWGYDWLRANVKAVVVPDVTLRQIVDEANRQDSPRESEGFLEGAEWALKKLRGER